MAEWILILTVTGGYHGDYAVHSIPAFKTEVACKAAGEKWKFSLPQARLGKTDVTAICVKSS